MDQLERIIELQQEQINRYDEYIRLFIDSRNVNVNKKSHILVPWKKTISENALKFTDDQILIYLKISILLIFKLASLFLI